MITADSGRTLDWEGGTLDELLGLLGEPALSAYIEAVRPGSGQAVGEIHVVAGGVSETIAGEHRGDEGLSYIKKIPGLRFRVTPALPNDEGLLLPPPDDEGQLSQRPVTALMRYCEEFVLTCALELARGQENARISYRRGEIIRTLVDGSESSERLPDVMGWSEGSWRIVLPQLNLPRPKKPQRPAPGELGGGTLFGIPAPVIPGLSGGPGHPQPRPDARNVRRPTHGRAGPGAGADVGRPRGHPGPGSPPGAHPGPDGPAGRDPCPGPQTGPHARPQTGPRRRGQRPGDGPGPGPTPHDARPARGRALGHRPPGRGRDQGHPAPAGHRTAPSQHESPGSAAQLCQPAARGTRSARRRSGVGGGGGLLGIPALRRGNRPALTR